MKKILMVAIVSLMIIVISGCIGQNEVKINANDGLSINSFVVEPSRIEYTDKADFYLEIENVGGTTASNIQAELYGVTWTELETREPPNGKLSPPDIRFTPPVAGGYSVLKWLDVQAPKLPEGLEHTYDITARVTYDYKTTGVANIYGITKDEYRRRQQSGTTTSTVTVTNTNAPVKIDVTGSQIVIDTSSLSIQDEPIMEVPLRITFTNVGSGVPITDGVNGKITGTITLEGASAFGASLKDCIDSSGEGSTVNVDTIIREGKTVTRPCTLVINKEAWLTRPEGTLNMIFDLRYRYYVEASTKLTVVGTKYGGTGGAGDSGSSYIIDV